MKKQLLLGIETSCDETGAAVLSKAGDRIEIVSNIIASSASIQAKYGGIIPEQAAREQIKSIIPVIEEALKEAKIEVKDLDAIAVTQGPGLIGSLLVGTEAAKTLAWVLNKPLIPINHLLGHFYANWINTNTPPQFPCLGLLVSGGHSDLVLFKNHSEYEYLGGTRDDAAGECFDKCARLLGLPYPGGPEISKLAKNGDPKAYKLPRPMLESKDFDFSFSGLKTAVANFVKQNPNYSISDLCACIEATIIELLVRKTVLAAKKTKIEHLVVAGGVAANQRLVSELKTKTNELGIALHIPSVNLCTDNGAMIAARGFFEKPIKDSLSLEANPSLSLNSTS